MVSANVEQIDTILAAHPELEKYVNKRWRVPRSAGSWGKLQKFSLNLGVFEEWQVANALLQVGGFEEWQVANALLQV